MSLRVKALVKEYTNNWDAIGYLVSLQHQHGLRISEVLNISPNDITRQGNIIIRTLKKGENRIVTPIIGLAYFIDCKRYNIYPFQDFDRFMIYRIYKKAGIVYKGKGNSKNSVTHAFRHLNTLSLKNDNIDKDIIKKSLGHKSEKTQSEYGKQ
jgi:integrase